MIHGIMYIAGIVANNRFVDSLSADVEAAASLATVDCKAIAFAAFAGRLVPDVQCDAVFVGSPAFAVECFAARRIWAWEN